MTPKIRRRKPRPVDPRLIKDAEWEAIKASSHMLGSLSAMCAAARERDDPDLIALAEGAFQAFLDHVGADLNLSRITKSIDPGCVVHPPQNSRIREAVWKMTSGHCYYCGYAVLLTGDKERMMQVDHLVAQAVGGPDHMHNFVPACPTCNLKKRDRPFVLFFQGGMIQVQDEVSEVAQ